MDTYEQVRNIVAEQMGLALDEVHAESNFVSDLGADSLDTVELIMGFEDVFRIQIPNNDVATIITVATATQYIDQHLRIKYR
jgi:acyl carrier protein